MVDLVRREVVDMAHTLVVKVGTNVLAGPMAGLIWSAFKLYPTSCSVSAPRGEKSFWSAPGPSAPVLGG